MQVALSKPQYNAFEAATQENGPRYVALVSGIGAGKTYVGALATATHVLSCKNSAVFVAGPTDSIVREVSVRQLLEFLPHGTIKSHNRTERRIELANGSTVYYRSTDIPDNLRGPNLDWVWADEAAMMDEEAALILDGRVRRKEYENFNRFLVTTTPRGRNWIWEWWEKQHRDNYRLIRMRTADNVKHLATGTLDSLYESYSGQWAAQELEGEFVSFEGLIWPMWDERVHLAFPQSSSDFRAVVCGVDFGFSHPTVFEVVAVDWEGGVWVVYEYAQTHLSEQELVETALDISRRYAVNEFLCDGAQPREIERLQEAGLPASKANKDVNAGLRVVAGLLEPSLRTGEPRMHVSQNCFLLRKQIPGYVRQGIRGKMDEFRDEPKKEADDAPDALRYACMGLEKYLNTEGKRPTPKNQHIWFGPSRGKRFVRVG